MPPPLSRSQPQRTTQGFVANLSWLRRRPVLLLIEIAWRWCFGIPALWLTVHQMQRALDAVPWQATGILGVTVNQLLTDPLTAATTIARFAALVQPHVAHALLWLAPLLFVAWSVVSGLGRTVLLRRMDTTLTPRPFTLILLQCIHAIPFAAVLTVWWFGMQALGRRTILQPIAAGVEPQMMLYVGGAIVLSLGLFVLSASASWLFSMPQLLAMLRNQGAVQSLRDTLRLRSMRGSLTEINLVLSIVKIALLVLAMVFSACPLPFQAETTDGFLLGWNIAVGIVWCIASDFFHVARLAGYLRLWQASLD